MIKFFRKFRQNLLQEGKTSKYFKYAIGEIVLVVIGILIALQINNWNENKTKEKEAYNQLLEVQNEIFNNILEYDFTGNFYNEKLRDLRSVFSDTLVFEDYKNNRSLSKIMSSYYPVITQNEAFDKLIQNADNLPDKYKPLILEMKKLYNLTGFETVYKSLLNLNNEYFDFTQDFNESLYRNELDDYIRFVMTNKDYKNKLARYSYTLDDITPALARKKYKAIEIYRQMVALEFPDKDLPQLKEMFVEINPETAAPFIGSYTNGIHTLTIHYNKKDNKLFGNWSFLSGEKIEDLKVIISDALTLNTEYGFYLEFNDDKSEFFTLQALTKPTYKRIPEND